MLDSTAGNTYQKTYFRNLDAPRFYAFLLVFIEHVIFTQNSEVRNSSLFKFYYIHLHLSALGIDIYTVLSGFLITWIIMEEYQFTDRFDLFYFWLKRCLRIWPLYFLMIAMGFILVWATRNFLGENVNDIPPLQWLLTFTLNIYIVKHGQAFLFFLVFFWSISIEEQCYVLWGIIMKWFKKALIPVCILLILASLVFRIFALHHLQNLQFNTLSWIGDFASGALLASFCIKKGKVFNRLIHCPKWIIALFYLLFAVNIAFYSYIYSSSVMTVLERLCATLFFSFIIFEQCFCVNRIVEIGKSVWLSYLGRISYGLFCYHGLIILFYERTTQQFSFVDKPYAVFVLNPLIIFALTVIVSALSYEYFERPVMSLRHRYSPI